MTILQLFSNLAEYHNLEYEFSESLEALYSLEFEETGLQVKQILESVYKDGITGLENVVAEDGKVTGIFLDRVASGLTKRFKFEITENEITYEPEDPDAMNFTEVDFATVAKEKKCAKGMACGNSCVPLKQPNGKPTKCRSKPPREVTGSVAQVLAKAAKAPKAAKGSVEQVQKKATKPTKQPKNATATQPRQETKQALEPVETRKPVETKKADKVQETKQEQPKTQQKAEEMKPVSKKYPLDDEKDFEDAVLNKFAELSAKYNGLVPIYQLRRELGETVPRDKFNNYMLNMQGNDLLLLQGGSVEDSARDKIADSVHTELDGTRTYARLGEALNKESLSKRVADTKDRVNEALKDKKPLSELGTAGALANAPKIKNQKEFDDAVEEASNRLNNEFIMGGIVPLEKIRKSLGDRISKEEFDTMIFDYIDKKDLELGEQKSPTKEELQKGVKDPFGETKTYLAVSSNETKSKDLIESKYPKSPEERFGDTKQQPQEQIDRQSPIAKKQQEQKTKARVQEEDKKTSTEGTTEPDPKKITGKNKKSDSITSKTDNREGKKTEFAEKWKKTWESAPSDLKEVLRRIDEPGEIISNSGTAFYNPNSSSINMNGYDPNANGSDRGASVYAHEYGHHIDYKAAEILGEKSLNSKLKAEGIPSIGELRQLGDSDEDTSIYANSMSKIKKILGVEDSQLITLSDIVKLANRSEHISSSNEGKEAFNADDQRLNELDRAGKSGKSQNDRDLRKSNLLDTTKEIAKKKALVELRKKNKKITALDSSDAHRKLVAKYQREAALDILGNSNTLVSKLITDKTDIVTINKLILDGVHPETIANLTEDYLSNIGKNADGHVQDLIGSITKNKVGKGHSDDYYESHAELTNAEAFANIIALHRLGNPVINEVLDYLAPNGHKFVKKILKDLIND